MAWLDYALAARVMCIRTSADTYQPITEPLRFVDWIARGHELGFPDVDDLDYHLSTLFPPVRPKGWLEIRYLDALPCPWWQVAAAVSTILLDDPLAAAEAEQASRGTSGLWCDAGRHGPSHPALARSAVSCFVAAIEALERNAVDAGLVDLCSQYLDRYVARGRCPADDTLEPVRSSGAVSLKAVFELGLASAVEDVA